MELTPNFKLSTGSYRVWKFPSGEIGVQLTDNHHVYHNDTTNPYNEITGSILSSDHIIELLQLVEAIRSNEPFTIDLRLNMPYCAYSRQDRICNTGESFSLKVFADLINSCNFSRVTTYDNHSDVATALINNCANIPLSTILLGRDERYCWELNINQYDFLVSPNAGANKKVFECSKYFNIPMIRADKIRNTSDGSIVETQVFATDKQLDNATVLIVDDICQGGRTFEELAKALKAIQPTVNIHLYVTHGFFNKGLTLLLESGISKIITTDSVIYNNFEEDVRLVDELTILEL